MSTIAAKTDVVRVYGVPVPVAVGVVGLLAVLAVCRPLGTYAFTLAVFGAPHVLSELRYVERRFASTIPRWTTGGVAVLLVAVVALRTSLLLGDVSRDVEVPAELVVVGLLAAAVAPLLVRKGVAGVAAIAGAVLVLVLATVAPLHALFALAILHNLTPLGFLADGLPPSRRRRDLAFAFVAMVGLPLLVATGLPRLLLTSAGLVDVDASIVPVGALSTGLGAYLHPDFYDAPWAVDVFAAAVLGQCLHYVATIGVLPTLLPGEARGRVPWPSGWMFVLAVVALSAPLTAAFVGGSFKDARQIYGVFAAVHAWVEVPALLLAWGAAEARPAR